MSDEPIFEDLESWLNSQTPRKVRVYTASKLHHAKLWQQLAQDKLWQANVEFTARWPFLHVNNIPDSAEFAEIFWHHDQEDVRCSDVVLVYAEKEDQLHGALVEAGMALAYGLHVIVVGKNKGYSTWQYHSQVTRVADLLDALLLLKQIRRHLHRTGRC